MASKNMPEFEVWENEKMNDAIFSDAARELEPGYQVARLRMLRGLTQAQLAEMVGAHHRSIARFESGSSKPSLSFLNKIAEALNARGEFRLTSNTKQLYS